MGIFRIKHSSTAVFLTCLLAGSITFAEEAVSPQELDALKAMMQEVMAENRDLSKRLHELESEINRLKDVRTKQEQTAREALTSEATEQDLNVVKTTTTEQALESTTAREESVTKSIIAEHERLEQRVKELETTQTAQEDATRWVISDAISSLGSNINEFVVLGGTLEVSPGWGENFTGPSEDVLRLDTAQLDFEIKVNDWMLGSLIVEYDDGSDALFTTTDETDVAVDRINIDTAYFTIGDPQRFPPVATFGRVILPFGISTGDPVADVLTLDDPLTLEVFEMRKTAIGFGLEFPTPALTPATPPVITPLTRPILINPLVKSLGKQLGYKPLPTPPPGPNYTTPPPVPPLFNAGLYFYDGNGDNWRPADHIDATIGFRTKGNCGRPYEELVGSFLCPWSIDLDIDYNSSVFNSRFLGFEYESFLDQIGHVPGMAAHFKASLGPVALVGEWNGATSQATFFDDLDNFVSIRPAAWQVSLGYQFDWNPWVDVIGAQGTYLALGYSESRDLAGVTRLISDEPNRVGFVPKRRYLLSVGEWVLDGFRFAIEYSYNVDYSISEGGTGNTANGIFSTFTYEW